MANNDDKPIWERITDDDNDYSIGGITDKTRPPGWDKGDVDPATSKTALEEATAGPIYTGDPGSFIYGGSQDALNFYRDLYAEGEYTAGNRPPPMADTTELENKPQRQFRQQQMIALAELQAIYEGKGPTSQAELMALQQGEAGKRAAMASAVSARGMTGSAALRGAQSAQTLSGIQAQQQRELIRQQEMADAQKAYGTLATQIRESDIGVATTQAELNQEIAEANLKSELETTALNDDLVSFYMEAGLTLEEAQLKANMDMEQMYSDTVRAQIAAEAGIVSSGIERTGRAQGATQAGVATGIATYIESRDKGDE